MPVEKFELSLIGVNHKSSSVSEREIFQIERKMIIPSLKIFIENDKIEGVIIVVTCSRLEFYLVVQQGFDSINFIENYYSKQGIDFDKYRHIFYQKKNEDEVTRHLFRVISGLDSLVLGEYQIQGQIRESYSKACEAKTVDKILHKLFHAAFRAGKNVRTNTKIGEGKQSVSGMASQILKNEINKSSQIALIGVNENTKIMAEELYSSGFHNLVFVNRTKYKAEILAEQYSVQAEGLDNIENVLSKSDAVFSSTGSKESIVSSELIHKLQKKNTFPKLVIDMAVPRDFDFKEDFQQVKYCDITALKYFLNRQEKEKTNAIEEAEQIIEKEVNIFKAWNESRTNTILEPYSEKFELIRQQLLEEYHRQFSVDAYKKADKMTKSLVHRMQSTFVRAILKTNQEIKVIKQHRDSI